MRRNRWVIALLALAMMLAVEGVALAQFKLDISGRTYTKWMWGNARREGSAYMYSDIPNDGAGDNGQFTEIEIFFNAKVSKYVEVQSRIHSRFNQNYWTNFGGFGGRTEGDQPCIAGDCGEYSPLSNQYLKLRGMSVFIRPGYGWLDEVLIGSNDMGGWDPWVVGQIRYIDRDNPSGIIARGSLFDKALTWRGQRLSLPRLWAGPGFNTGDFHASDAAYTGLFDFSPGDAFDVTGIYNWVNDIEIDPDDRNPDNGIETRVRFRNTNYGVRLAYRPTDAIELRGNFYHSESETSDEFGAGYASFSPVIYGDKSDNAWKAAADFNDPFDVGLSFKAEYFDIGADYVALLSARREVDILLTEGWDAAFAMPGPDNLRYSVYRDAQYLQGEALAQNIGWGGWNGTMQQVISLGVDNNITDFNEPLAQDVHGWKGFTLVPLFQAGDLTLQAEVTLLDYNTNWQEAWGGADGSTYPTFEWFTGVGTTRPVYQPFQDRDTKIYVLNAKYLAPVGRGLELDAKIKKISDTDKRLENAALVPNIVPTVVGPADGYEATGYAWAPFDDVTDDDRDLDYMTYQIGVGYQFRDEFWAGLRFENYDVDLRDGTTAIRGAWPGNWFGYGDQADPSGSYDKNKLSLMARYTLGGAEIRVEYQYNYGSFTPDFGDGFVARVIDGERYFQSVGYRNPQPMSKRDFDQQRLHAFLKLSF
ncbi:MAG: hypothetical protein M5U13_16940 [Thermoanaerobaculia bacterium]|nr:hypothetical protein [Thermoanaerobaculia bacterium]